MPYSNSNSIGIPALDCRSDCNIGLLCRAGENWHQEHTDLEEKAETGIAQVTKAAVASLGTQAYTAA